MTDQNDGQKSNLDVPDDANGIETGDPISPEDLIDEIERASREMDELHSKFADATTKTGFAKEALKLTKDHVINLIQSDVDSITYQPVIDTLFQEVVSYRQEIGQVTINSSPVFHKVDGLASTSYSMLTSSGSLAYSINPSDLEDLFIPYQFKPKNEEIKAALTKIDPPLFDIYREIEQILYNTRADNIKMALAATRQTFDHFFDFLAPEDKVRASKFWKPKKEEGREDKIDRVERMRYSVATHIKDPFRANTLIASIKNILATYEVLHKFHTRGKVNVNSTKKAIYTIVHFLEEFALAMDE